MTTTGNAQIQVGRGASVTVRDLVPGDKVTNGTVTATFVQQAEHPDPGQVVGEVAPMTLDARKQALREALLHRSQW